MGFLYLITLRGDFFFLKQLRGDILTIRVFEKIKIVSFILIMFKIYVNHTFYIY
jgi:hypothetical protein